MLHPELCRPDYISIHTIQLLTHNRQLRNATTQLSNAEKSDLERRIPSISPSPVLGSIKVSNKSDTENSGRSSPLMLNEGTIEIDETVAKQLSRRAVATICAHSGFEMSQESALDCLTDVLHEYLLKFCKRLRLAVDREATYGTTSFQDVLTDVFKDIGIDNTEVLYQFWKTRIKDYHDFIERKNKKLQDQYQSLINPVGDAVESTSQVKQETSSEIQFTENFPDLLDQLPDTSTSGISYQGLSTLELEENSRAAASNSEDADTAQWLEGQIKLETTDKDSSANDSTDRNSQNDSDSLTLGPSPSGSSNFDGLSPVSVGNPRKKRKK
ncbi:STAGA complex 65 subunit gamma-like isoform X2 [Anneissia japonica]|uniref:STAGA complex 65 subunit gamma-like isoform X2 n=1 Tax=Anneissia japonica TaxID=1529436 RepID=UPI0014256784|nr:STAGA complex 65 subunit gamma-like isoform X2 [Anneissia japonica]